MAHDPKPRTIGIEVVYALKDEQVLIELEVEEGLSARQAIERSGILERFPGIKLERGNIGVFGKPIKPDRPVRAGDRVEIYHSLIADPGENRRKRAGRRR